MKAVAEIQVIPIGVGVSVRAQVRRAQELIRESGLIVQEHSFGTEFSDRTGSARVALAHRRLDQRH